MQTRALSGRPSLLVQYASPEQLLAMKMVALRQQDAPDIAALAKHLGLHGAVTRIDSWSRLQDICDRWSWWPVVAVRRCSRPRVNTLAPCWPATPRVPSGAPVTRRRFPHGIGLKHVDHRIDERHCGGDDILEPIGQAGAGRAHPSTVRRKGGVT